MQVVNCYKRASVNRRARRRRRPVTRPTRPFMWELIDVRVQHTTVQSDTCLNWEYDKEREAPQQRSRADVQCGDDHHSHGRHKGNVYKRGKSPYTDRFHLVSHNINEGALPCENYLRQTRADRRLCWCWRARPRSTRTSLAGASISGTRRLR